MYHECIMCPQLGITCDGPNFLAVSAQQILEWCKKRKKFLGLSNAKLAEMSNQPKGTIDRLFAGEHYDFKFETIRPVIKALIGGPFEGRPCPAPPPDYDGVVREAMSSRDLQIQELMNENSKLKDMIINNLLSNLNKQ